MSKYDPRNCEFSEDPQENLRIENEILKLKLQAQYGGMHGSFNDVPPEIEHVFLKQVERFEKEWQKQRFNLKTVYEVLGKPWFANASKLKPSELEAQLKRLLGLFEQRNINVHFIHDYHPLIKYKFITEELFHEEMENMNLPGWTMNFIYEEFHPEE